MDIYPQDMGFKPYVRLLRHRAQPMELSVDMSKSGYGDSVALIPSPLGPLRRAWLHGSGVDEETARYAEPAFEMESGTVPAAMAGGLPFLLVLVFALVFHAFGIAALDTGLLALFGYCYGIVGPRRSFKELHRKVSVAEISYFQKHLRDPLKRDYLELVLMLIKLPPTRDAAYEKNMRDALRTLGMAIEGLPPPVSEGRQEDPAAIQSEADHMAARAQQEQDPIVAASLDRQAASLGRRAAIVSRITTHLRRNEALRQEIAEQVETLRTSLAAFGMGCTDNVHEMVDLAEGIRRVANEAVSMAVAQEELDSILHTDPVRTPTVGDVSVQRIGLS